MAAINPRGVQFVGTGGGGGLPIVLQITLGVASLKAWWMALKWAFKSDNFSRLVASVERRAAHGVLDIEKFLGERKS